MQLEALEIKARATHALLFGIWICLAACASHEPKAAEWGGDWNARVDAAESDLHRNPCGDFVFDRWADEFLAGCQAPREAAAQKECDARTAWVWARWEQCDVWQDWVLRNHNQRERRDHLKEPEVRVSVR